MKKYTLEEDQVIVESVQNNPTNLRKAFEEASKRLNKSYSAVASRYYNAIRKKEPIMFLATRRQLVPNAKNDVIDQQSVIIPRKKKEVIIELEGITIKISQNET